MWDNATLNEELWHVTGLMSLRSEWEEQGRPGDFNLYENARMTEMFDEMGGRIRSLDGAERAETEQALVDSFNLYFPSSKRVNSRRKPWRRSRRLSESKLSARRYPANAMRRSAISFA
jgi:glycine/D-amino acid oxidase-like deaminating enzyme